MTYEEAIAYLESHIGAGIRPGLERISTILEMLGEPQKAYPIIHVAGTNGKTSVTRMITSILVGHGLRVGSTTSPHLSAVQERLEIDGVPASEEAFAQAVEDVVPFLEIFRERHGDHPTYFELTTLLAFSYFAAEAVDVAVVEVGLGGRLDATNAADAEVAVVTSISLDHTEYLGETLAEIAGEKVAIAKAGATLVTGRLPEEARVVTQQHATSVGIRLLQFGDDFEPLEPVMAVGGWSTSVRGHYSTYEDIFLPLHGRHQLDNLSLATAAVEAFFSRALSAEGMRLGLSGVAIPGRLEVASRHPAVLIDGAHNPGGFAALTDALSEEFRLVEWVAVIGAMADKDVPEMVATLDGHVRAVFTTAVDDPRALTPEQLAEIASSVLDVPVEAVHGPEAALSAAVSACGGEDAVLVTGSLYLVGEIRSLIDPQPVVIDDPLLASDEWASLDPSELAFQDDGDDDADDETDRDEFLSEWDN